MRAQAIQFNENLLFPPSLAFGCRNMFRGANWHVVALGVRVFVRFWGPSVGVSLGEKKGFFFFLVVKLERSIFMVAEQLLNNACV